MVRSSTFAIWLKVLLLVDVPTSKVNFDFLSFVEDDEFFFFFKSLGLGLILQDLC